MKSDYPKTICRECALKNKGTIYQDHISCFHHGKCGWCQQMKTVTEPRDYGYPIFNPKKSKISNQS